MTTAPVSLANSASVRMSASRTAYAGEMLPLTVIIPWRPQASRIAAFDAVVDWYRWNIPGVDIETVDCDQETFNLSRCRNRGIARIEDPDRVVIINDADTIPQLDSLREAIVAASTSGLVHLPYTRYHWLGATGTNQYSDGTPLEDCDYELIVTACSGVYVTTPASWFSHGGQDERFRGWGFEDAAWHLAHETLLGAPPHRHFGSVFALHHEPQLREGPQFDANAHLMQQYRDAASNPDAMRDLVFTAR